MKVLFVCRGNVGRSQALREFVEQEIARNPSLNISVDSAGTDTKLIRERITEGKHSIPAGLVKIYVRAFGITPKTTRRKPVTLRLIRRNDIILVAEPRLKKYLHTRYPAHGEKILTIKEYLWPKLKDASQVIDDPREPTTRRYGAGKVSKPGNQMAFRNYKMLRECKGIARRLLEKWGAIR